jgi:magnesium-dependent phosphatase 1
MQMLKLLQISNADGTERAKAIDFFPHYQIYPGDKRTHMQRLNKATGIAYEDFLFFDDESRNRNVESLGVTFWFIRDGITKDEIDNGVSEWRARRSR